MVEERWKNGEYILDADSFRDGSSTPEATAATGANDELFFRRWYSPAGNGMYMYQQHRLCDTTKAAC